MYTEDILSSLKKRGVRSSRPSEETVRRAQTLGCTGDRVSEGHLATTDQQAYRKSEKGIVIRSYLSRESKSSED